MRFSSQFQFNSNKKQQQYLTYSILCLSLVLSACQKEAPPAPAPTPNQVELIAQDLVAVQTGSLTDQAAFTGTIRAVNQSSIQAQVTATATQVNVQVGQRVARGDILVRLNNQDNAARLAQARANLASAKAQANQAQLMMQRKKRLLDQGFIAKMEYEQSQVDYQAQLENARAMQANVDIAVKADQDGIITSPLNGVITQRQVEPGQTVTAGQTLFEIVNPDVLEIQAKIANDQQRLLQVGQNIEYRIQGNPDVLNAKVSRISPLADQSNRQIEFFATPQQAIPTLSIGAFVEGHLLGQSQTQGQIIPLDTIRDLDGSPYVWLVRNNKLQKVKIQVLQQNYSNNTAVVSGLDNSDRISRVTFNDADINKAIVISKS